MMITMAVALSVQKTRSFASIGWKEMSKIFLCITGTRMSTVELEGQRCSVIYGVGPENGGPHLPSSIPISSSHPLRSLNEIRSIHHFSILLQARSPRAHVPWRLCHTVSGGRSCGCHGRRPYFVRLTSDRTLNFLCTCVVRASDCPSVLCLTA